MNITACLMRGASIAKDTFPADEKLESNQQCKERCKEDRNCLRWTHIGGMCYLKKENTFTVENSLVTAGKKGCHREGILFYVFLLVDLFNIKCYKQSVMPM